MQRAYAGLAALVVFAAVVLAACAGGIPKHEDPAQVRERFAWYAGAPVDRMVWLGHYYSWDAVGENELVVFTTPSDAFLLKVSGPCNDL